MTRPAGASLVVSDNAINCKLLITCCSALRIAGAKFYDAGSAAAPGASLAGRSIQASAMPASS